MTSSPRLINQQSAVRGLLAAVAVLAVVCGGTGCSARSAAPVAAPPGGTAVGIADDNPGSIWIATRALGVFRSITGGHSWVRVRPTWGTETLAFLPEGTVLGDGTRLTYVAADGSRIQRLPAAPVGFLALATSFPATGRMYGLGPSGRLWVSARGARVWQPLLARGLPPLATSVAAVRGDPTKSDVIYVGAPDGIRVSSDFGRTFHKLAGSPVGVVSLGTTTDGNQRLLVGTDAGIYLSRDAGATFRRVSSRPVAAVAYDWRNWRDAVALTGDGTLLRSSDGGLTW